ncbi:C-X-C chemokine receptor type 3-like [Platysternon megacephalum]|uniref:C-X-C chemokine receptor type 3-like n=1 Tax=Platysternon megacephalum TaxID=55544 RepID=A0A4D9DVV8_9SAUR|nr:C-X-C chemokine receptor type 3-like [Platysternon megacephalum]
MEEEDTCHLRKAAQLPAESDSKGIYGVSEVWLVSGKPGVNHLCLTIKRNSLVRNGFISATFCREEISKYHYSKSFSEVQPIFRNAVARSKQNLHVSHRPSLLF